MLYCGLGFFFFLHICPALYQILKCLQGSGFSSSGEFPTPWGNFRFGRRREGGEFEPQINNWLTCWSIYIFTSYNSTDWHLLSQTVLKLCARRVLGRGGGGEKIYNEEVAWGKTDWEPLFQGIIRLLKFFFVYLPLGLLKLYGYSTVLFKEKYQLCGVV